jgi:hypothetical protein
MSHDQEIDWRGRKKKLQPELELFVFWRPHGESNPGRRRERAVF